MKYGVVKNWRMWRLMAFLFVMCSLFCTSCKKVAGEGGNSSISGVINKSIRIVLTNPSTTQGTVTASDHDVFIIYGDDESPGDKVETSYDGHFQFNELRPGNYTLYTYSRDTNSVAVPWDEDHMPVKVDIEITDKKQEVDAGTLTIYDVE